MDETDRLVAQMTQWAEWFIRRAFHNRRDQGNWLVLEGAVGCGKTHLARRTASFLKMYSFEAWQAHWSQNRALPVTILKDWPRLAEIREEADFDDVIQDVLTADIVILDDVGAEIDRFKSGAPASRLRRVLSGLENRWLLITTNLPKNVLNRMYDERVKDRLDAAQWFDGSAIPSYRSKLKA